MFEKEAEEYLKKDGTKAEQILNMINEISPLKITLKQVPFILAMIQQVFKDGAEFGYNKANEWHKVADGDYPPSERGNYSINVLTDCGDIAYYNYDMGCWVAEPSSSEIDPPVAWCEIPKFEGVIRCKI